MESIFKGRYRKALRLLFNSKNQFVRRAVNIELEKTMRSEMKEASSSLKKSSWAKTFTHSNLKEFNLGKSIIEAEKALPSTVACIKGMLPPQKQICDRLFTGKKSQKRYTI